MNIHAWAIRWGVSQAALEDLRREAHRRFFIRYGVDVATAQALGPDEAAALEAQVREDLGRAGVVAC